MKKILVTGSAGFIGFHLSQRLLKEGYTVVGLDNINNYYDINLKYARLAETGIYAPSEKHHTGGKNRTYKEIAFGETITSLTNPDYKFIRLNLEDKPEIEKLFATEKFDYVVNLAAQAGVRYSIENPDAYIQSNIVGFLNILEACRNHPVKHLVYASSSSVYGANAKIPFSETDQVDNPVSLYAATKKSNELMAHTYSHLYKTPTTGLRFFTVYGPWGRPDMAPILFASAIAENRPIKVFNNGNMERDFTYIDDIVEGIKRLIPLAPSTNANGEERFSEERSDDAALSNTAEPKKLEAPYRILNIGNGSPVNLLTFIETMEQAIGKKAEKIMLPMQEGDVKQTWADVNRLASITGQRPEINITDGIGKFAEWFKSYRFDSCI
jgi:UDP-glucuronate 4-epimerase